MLRHRQRWWSDGEGGLSWVTDHLINTWNYFDFFLPPGFPLCDADNNQSINHGPGFSMRTFTFPSILHWDVKLQSISYLFLQLAGIINKYFFTDSTASIAYTATQNKINTWKQCWVSAPCCIGASFGTFESKDGEALLNNMQSLYIINSYKSLSEPCRASDIIHSLYNSARTWLMWSAGWMNPTLNEST